jgi:CHAT domain
VLFCVAGALSSRDRGTAGRLELEFAGCARVRPGPVCELGRRRELTLWVPGAEKPQLGAAARVRRAKLVESGWQLLLDVAPAARVLRVRAGERWAELRIAESSEPARLRELAELWRDGHWEQVRATLDAAEAELEGPERERIAAFRARLALRDGDNARAASELERTAKSAQNAGLLLEAGQDRFAAAYVRTVRLGQYEHARLELDATAELDAVPEVRARLAYHRGILARTTGDTQGALTELREASVRSRRLDLVADELTARQELALMLNRLHRHAEALAEQEAVVARDAELPSCVDALRWENLSWILLSQPEPSLERAAVALDRVESLQPRCPDPLSRRNQALNRVQLALLRGELTNAATLLRALEGDATGRSTRLAAWQALYSGKLWLATKEGSRAVAAFERAAALAESARLLDCGYLAKLGRARALAQRGDSDSVAAYLDAEEAVDALVRAAPFGQGQQLTALQAQESSQELLSLLLQRERVADAYALTVRAARRTWAANFRAGRIAALHGPQKARWDRAVAEYLTRRQALERAARDDWRLSSEGLLHTRLSRALELQRLENALAEAYSLLAEEPVEELPRPSQDAELTLARGSDGWFAFLSRGDDTPRVERLSDVARDLGAALERFEREKLLDVPLLRVVVPPELSTLDVHALEVGGQPLIARVPVAYSFEPGRAQPSSPHARARGPLVLGNPNDDLPWALAEAQRLSQRLTGAVSLFGGRVSRASVESYLPTASLLHFAGHASSGGLDGLDGALHLAGGQRLSFGDVFALRGVPELVVLSACTSSVSHGSGAGLGIGQAFVAAGSRAVVGSSRDVSDRLARDFTQRFYDALLGASSRAVLPRDHYAWASAFRVASMKVMSEDPGADWASLRLLVP